MKNIILSTDWWTDCDDAVAIRVIEHAVKSGDFHLSGVVVNAFIPESVPSILAFLDDCGLLAGTPVAFDREATDFTGKPKYQYPIAAAVGDKYKDFPIEEPVSMLRRVLASSAEPVEIIEIGFPQCLAALLESAPDERSPLSGVELVREKVPHLWMMAGNYQNETSGSEHNFNNTRRSASGGSIVCEKWPTPITFLGWEVGYTVITGRDVPADDLLKQLMTYHGSANGRCSWDPMTVELALLGSADAAGYDAVRGRVSVNPETGENSFVRDCEGLHEYVIKRLPDEAYAARIDAMLVRE